MFGIGMSEMLIILVVALLVFGPAKLPEVARSVARGLRELRKAGDDLRASIDLDVDDERPAARTQPSPARPLASGEASADVRKSDVPGAPERGPATDAPDAAEVAAGRGAPQSNAGQDIWPRPAEGTLARGALHEAPQTPDAAPATGPQTPTTVVEDGGTGSASVEGAAPRTRPNTAG